MEHKKRRTFIEAQKVPQITPKEQEVLQEIQEEMVCRNCTSSVREATDFITRMRVHATHRSPTRMELTLTT